MTTIEFPKSSLSEVSVKNIGSCCPYVDSMVTKLSELQQVKKLTTSFS